MVEDHHEKKKAKAIIKTSAPPTSSPTGAGLRLDPLSQTLITSWISNPQLLHQATLPLTIDQNQATDGHQFISFTISDDKSHVRVKAKLLRNDNGVEIDGDLLIAADRCLSLTRQHFLPALKLRYSGYCAWRGVLDFSGKEDSETIKGIRKAYPDLGKCLYFDLGSGTHAVLYELLNKRLNWIFYVNQIEPEIKRNSLTMKLIYWDNVVLIGDAAHPTTPHGLRSTNMTILDAAVLGKCLENWGVENLHSALEEYQSTRFPVTSKQVLHSRWLGQIKQGLHLPDQEPFDPKKACPEDLNDLQQKNMPFFTINH
ncbi:Acyl-CoA N-acyltransferases (NAT) superfamily protein [Hibiscus syriacus]|uniref:Acyl-CoA N-acyltransferases (NAT) superfamily protein n=1 Tax=Hibiscus syriacus TaxID=106335 RepID=A0A6A3D1G9_HIBSY|nr:Acyl-CoA N-acyltransferases (NAT) superfamily protein [Hibiscus syriacus]